MVTMGRPRIDNQQARRLFLDRHLLLRPSGGNGKGRDLDRVLDQLGFVQVDSVNTLARAHDLILWSRRGQYRPVALERLVARDRTAFEHWTHDAAIIPMAFYPMWRLKFARDRARLQARWPEARRAGWQRETDAVLRHISEHGATCTRDVAPSDGQASSGWWDWHPSKTALEFLWRSGQLAICHRKGFRKFYDLSERVVPEQYREKIMDTEDVIDWAMVAALSRLGFGTSGELAGFFDIVTREEAKLWCARALEAGQLTEVDVEMADGRMRRSLMTDETIAGALSLPEPTQRVRLLSPFDPAVRDRARAERLFGFHFRIEIFVPEPRRTYGYYVFPVLQGDRIIGRLDAKRRGDALSIRAFWPEEGVRMGKARKAALLAEVERVGRLANAKALEFDKGWCRT